jgi:hypothetical protein
MKTMEETILGAVHKLLLTDVNECIKNEKLAIPEIDDFHFSPVIKLSGCERTDKERVLLLDAYTVKISFTAPETRCYEYAAMINRCLNNDRTLGGIAIRSDFTHRIYKEKDNEVEAVFTLRIVLWDLE